MSKLRVFLADDHAVVREGLKALLLAQTDIEVVGEAADGRKAVECCRKLQPDVVVMDISMPELNGTQAAYELKKLLPKINILMLTVHEDQGYLRELLETGASGYVLKRSASEELVRAVRVVASGEVYLDPKIAGKLVGGFLRKQTAREPHEEKDLTKREIEVLRLIAQGYSNKEIGAQLDVSVKTIETHKARSMEKLGLRSRVDIVRYALHRGWMQNI